MKASSDNLNLQVNFEQVVELIKQLPPEKKIKLKRILKKEMKEYPEKDEVMTHIASEKTLAKDWQLPEEDQAWKDL